MSKPLNIIYAEDEKSVRDMTSGAITSFLLPGSQLTEKESAEDLVGYVHKTPVDLIITDGRLKGHLLGLDAIKILRKKGYTAPALLMTGTPYDVFPDGLPKNFDFEGRNKIPGVINSYMLVKPVSMPLLKSTLETLLQESQAQPQTQNTEPNHPYDFQI